MDFDKKSGRNYHYWNRDKYDHNRAV